LNAKKAQLISTILESGTDLSGVVPEEILSGPNTSEDYLTYISGVAREPEEAPVAGSLEESQANPCADCDPPWRTGKGCDECSHGEPNELGLYRPSNDKEGSSFWSTWCEKCLKMRANVAAGEPCPVYAKIMRLHIDHPDYPKEWRYGSDGNPICTAFDEQEVAI
ncbi:MAG: hypothetical protein ACLGPL_11595, partial [Acidobacteriota bacterium]